jgi:hypothetical protein
MSDLRNVWLGATPTTAASGLRSSLRSASAEQNLDRAIEVMRLVEEVVRAVAEALPAVKIVRFVREDDDLGVRRKLSNPGEHGDACLLAKMNIEHDDVDARRREDGEGLSPIARLEHRHVCVRDALANATAHESRILDEQHPHVIRLGGGAQPRRRRGGRGRVGHLDEIRGVCPTRAFGSVGAVSMR